MKIILVILFCFLLIQVGRGQNIKLADYQIIDSTVCPGDNFYQFCSGKWINNNKIPSGKHRYGFYDIADKKIQEQIESVIINSAKNSSGNKLQSEIGKFYASGMDSNLIEKLGISAIDMQLEMIRNIQSKADIIQVLADFQLSGINPLFQLYDYKYWEILDKHYLYLKQSSFGLSKEQFSDNNYANEQKVYKKLIKRILELSSENNDTIEKLTDFIYNLESKLSELQYSESELRNFHKNYNLYSIQQASKQYNNIDWNTYLENLNGNIDKFIIAQPKYFDEIDQQFTELTIEQWKVYLKWQLLFSSSAYLSSPFSDTFKEFRNETGKNHVYQEDRNKLTCHIINQSLNEAVGYLYKENNLNEATIKQVEKINESLRKSFIARIEQNTWLSNKAKNNGIEKVNNMNFKIGGPEFNEADYSSLDLSESTFLQNIFACKKTTTRLRLEKCGTPKLNEEWTVSAHSTNAWYSSNRNDITIPAGNINMLFSNKSDVASNYGSFAVNVAHEMTHGFDNTGRNYDANGKFKNLWTRSDEKNFEMLTKALIAEYNNFHLTDSFYVNGKATLSENIADLGAIQIAFDALQNELQKEDLSDDEILKYNQMFFVAYAQKWRDLLSDTLKVYYSKHYQHAPPEARCNLVLYNTDSFYQVFNIQNGKAYKEVSKRISIW